MHTDLPHLLVVEDLSGAQLLFTYFLRSAYRVTIAAGAAEAVRLAQTDDFDLFLLDIKLNDGRSGLELLGELRALPGKASVPALAVTAYALSGDRERFMQVGFDGYVAKPFTKEDLLEAIEAALPAKVS